MHLQMYATPVMIARTIVPIGFRCAGGIPQPLRTSMPWVTSLVTNIEAAVLYSAQSDGFSSG